MIDPSSKNTFDFYWNRMHLESQTLMASSFIEEMKKGIRVVDCMENPCENDRNMKEYFQYVIGKFEPLLAPLEPEPVIT